MNIGDALSFNYTGGMQSVVLDKGLYKFECWGAQGGNFAGNSNIRGGKGGYAYGHKIITEPTTIYICVGQQGANCEHVYSPVWLSSSYNGGGAGISFADSGSSTTGGSSGGGCTHMALVSGTLASIGKTSFLTNGLLVAGAGGGCSGGSSWGHWTVEDNWNNGVGGGLTGGNGIDHSEHGWAGGTIGTGGSQSAGGTGGNSGSFGAGGNGDVGRNARGGGGGAGFYGGGSGSVGTWEDNVNAKGAGGGSSYIALLPSITFKGTVYGNGTYGGAREGNGYARITLIDKTFPSVIFNGVTMDAAIIDGVSIDSFILNGVSI